jgi:hypothetical protein
MINRDYILRMIEQLSRVLAKVLLMKQAKDFSQAAEEIKKAGKQLLGLNADAMELLADRDLIHLWTVNGEVDAGKCALASQLFKTQGDICRDVGDVDGMSRLYEKALSLVVEAINDLREDVPREIVETFEQLASDVDITALPVEFKKRIFHCWGTIGRYGKAEDVLFDIVKENCGYVNEGKRFYQQILKRSDQELENGNLPRQEILQSLSELDRIR